MIYVSLKFVDLFIPVIMLITIRFKPSVLLGTHTLLRVLQLVTHLSKLMTKVM